jgi:hypothetical protein
MEIRVKGQALLLVWGDDTYTQTYLSAYHRLCGKGVPLSLDNPDWMRVETQLTEFFRYSDRIAGAMRL